MARVVPAGSGRGEEAGPERSSPDSPVTLATVLSRLAAELADLRATHAAEQALSQRLGRERAAALDELARTREEKVAVEAALAEAAAREAVLRRELGAGQAQLDEARRARAALLIDVERLLQAVEPRLGTAWAILGGRAAEPPALPVPDEVPPIVAVATGLGRRGARKVAAAVARQAKAADAGAVLITDEAVPETDDAAPSPLLRIVRLPRPSALPSDTRDAYRAARLRLLLEIWSPARVVPFGPDAARLLTLDGNAPGAAEADQAATAEGLAAAARS